MKLTDEQIIESIAPKDAGWIVNSDKIIKGRRDFGVISEGCDPHAFALCKYVFKDESLFYDYFRYEQLFAECFIPVIIGFFYKDRRQRDMHLRFARIDTRKAVNEQKPVIIWWVGTDIMNLKFQWEQAGDKRFVEKLNHPNIINVVETTAIKQELEPYIKNLHVCPITAPVEYDVMPIPPSKKVAVYLPPGRKEFYHYDLILEAAKQLPDVTFIFYASQEIEYDMSKLIEGTENCWNFGALDRDDMERLVADCRVYLRITEHDGLPLSILEFGMAGRHVIFNHADILKIGFHFPGNKSEELASVIQAAISIDKPEEALARHYKERYGHAVFLKKFNELLEIAKGRL